MSCQKKEKANNGNEAKITLAQITQITSIYILGFVYIPPIHLISQLSELETLILSNTDEFSRIRVAPAGYRPCRKHRQIGHRVAQTGH